MTNSCKAIRERDGSWRCLPCHLTWDNDDEKPPCKIDSAEIDSAVTRNGYTVAISPALAARLAEARRRRGW